METIWAFLSDANHQRTLAWLGSGLVVVVVGLWVVIKHFFHRSSGNSTQSISADRGSIAAGRDVKIGDPPRKPRQ